MSYQINPAYHFSVEWGGNRSGFSEVSGLDTYFDPIVFRDSISPQEYAQSVPGRIRYGNIILKRTLVKGDLDFVNWLNSKVGTAIERRDVVIKLLNGEHQPIFTWKVVNAYPVRYSGPKLHSTDNALPMEELELAHDGIHVESIT